MYKIIQAKVVIFSFIYIYIYIYIIFAIVLVTNRWKKNLTNHF
ncbi:MAG: hypothetical protein N7Q72_06660 [Spiroplasma sp. Tabriz.8]|nr:hypothetical protein [Spiroplasma sp. Tabriz.8]